MLGLGLCGLRLMVGGGPPPFDPAQMAGVAAWYDPSDLSTLFQDVAMTVPVTAAGQSVAAMRDKSGNGWHMIQATSSKRPILALDAGRYHLLSDGVDDEMTVASRFGLAVNPALTVIAGMRPITSPATDSRVIEIGTDLGAGVLSCAFGTDGWSWRHNNGNAVFSPLALSTDVVACWQRNTGSTYSGGQFWKNGQSQSLVSSSGGTLLPTDAGAAARLFRGGTTGTAYANMRLYGLVVGAFFDRTRASQLEAWMAGKSGVTL